MSSQSTNCNLIDFNRKYIQLIIEKKQLINYHWTSASKLYNYLNDEPLTDNQIDQLIELFTDNEADIFDAGYMTDTDKIKLNQRWRKADIDDLSDWFVSFVEGLANNWEEYPLDEIS